MTPTVILLTFNSADSIANTLESIRGLSDDIHLVDSGSTDATLTIAQGFDVHVHHHPFKNYGDQRNWAIDHVPCKYAWQLHLDADEQMSETLRANVVALSENVTEDGFFISRYLRFLGRTLKHNLAPTWHMRLFRAGAGRCELREYDQHFFCTGTTGRLEGAMIDDIRMPLTEWTARHNRWADAEVRELLSSSRGGRIEAKATGNAVEKKRYLRSHYDRAPLFLRAFALFFYRYILRFGFLDGTEGFIFCVLQTLWFRFLVDAKLWEAAHLKPGGEERAERPQA